MKLATLLTNEVPADQSMLFILLGAGLLIIIVAVIIAVISAVTSAVAAETDTED